MADEEREAWLRRAAATAAGRLSAGRWVVTAGALAGLLVYIYGGGTAGLVAFGLFAFVVAVAPSGGAQGSRGAGSAAADGSAFGRLSGEALAAAVADPLIVFDAHGGAVFVNDAATAAFGAMRPGMPLPLKFRAPEMQALLEEVLAGAPAGETDYIERVPVEKLYRARAAAVGGSTGLYVLAFKDQSEARRIDRMRADFIANASHELRTPLASIAGFVETLRGPAKNDTAARERFLGIMQDQTARMSRLIDDLLSLSRLEMKQSLKPGASADVGKVIRGVANSLKPTAADSGVAIKLVLPQGPLEVFGDRDELVQVFENLIENACKYGQSGKRVVVSAERAEDGPAPEVRVTVQDFGPGIAAEHIPRITERFYRVDGEGSRGRKGTGLGLAIVKHILTRHGGRLSVESEVGKGSAFTVHLPLR